MTPSRDTATAQRLLGQGRILEALAEDDVVITGTLARIGRQFGLSADDLRICLRELLSARWIAVTIQPFGRLAIRLERRSQDGPPPVTGERRQPVADAWRL